jgi:signal transduction histidine kinase
MAVLFAAAALCIAGLTIRRLPSIAWLATASAAGIAAVEIVAVLRNSQPLAAPDARPALVALSGLAFVCGVGVAAAYAAHRREPAGRASVARSAPALGAAAVALSALAAVWALAAAAADPISVATSATDPTVSPIRLAARLSLGLIAIGIVFGMARDLWGPLRRALDRRRATSTHGSGTGSSFLALLADELLPTRSIERRRAAESERARLAAELHAFVLPDLRQAAAAASSSDVPDDVATGVRRSLDGVERLMNERQSIVLEQFGLVAALEWLAERTEERSPVRVELELDGDRVDDRTAVPMDVARAAFRVTLLALDNVVRHASATLATVRLSVTSDQLRLTISNDGRAVELPTAGSGGRGVVDMRTEAEAVGAAVSMSRLDAGTRVEMAWPATAGTTV